MDLTPTIGEYRVCALPDDHPKADFLTIHIRRHHGDRWLIQRLAHTLGPDGQWRVCGPPKRRGDTWEAANLHTLDEAIRLAQQAAPHLAATVFRDGRPAGSRTAAELAREIEEQGATA